MVPNTCDENTCCLRTVVCFYQWCVFERHQTAHRSRPNLEHTNKQSSNDITEEPSEVLEDSRQKESCFTTKMQIQNIIYSLNLDYYHRLHTTAGSYCCCLWSRRKCYASLVWHLKYELQDFYRVPTIYCSSP